MSESVKIRNIKDIREVQIEKSTLALEYFAFFKTFKIHSRAVKTISDRPFGLNGPTSTQVKS